MNIDLTLSLLLDFDDLFEGALIMQVFFYIVFALIFVTIVFSIIKAWKKKVDSSDTTHTRLTTFNQNTKSKEEAEYCEYCGGVIPKNRADCPSCGAKRKKK